MREYAKKPESQSRTLDTNPKASRQAPIDVILQRYKQNIQRYASSKEEELLQRKFESTTASEQEPVQREEKPNNTGLPDNLKIGIENLSGYRMDDVMVHYNSDKPVQLNALAYTQGTDIHVAPSQEKHLPHEAWHVVQQKQGRVQPTMQLHGVQVNDDEGLEREADVMGENILQRKSIIQSTNVIQREPMEYEDFKSRFPKTYKGLFNALEDNKIWRFTSYPTENIGIVENKADVIEQITGRYQGECKPLSFGHNLYALIGTALCGRGDGNVLTYITKSEYLCSVDMRCYLQLKEMGFIVYTGTSNELTIFETECVLGRNLATKTTSLKDLQSTLGTHIQIMDNPYRRYTKEQLLNIPNMFEIPEFIDDVIPCKGKLKHTNPYSQQIELLKKMEIEFFDHL